MNELTNQLLAALHTADRTFAENGLLASHAARQEIRAALAAQPGAVGEPLPDYSGMSREALERHAQRMAQTLGDDRAWKFYRKHADGPMLPPSCLCCGQLPGEVAIKHLELPGIVVCKKCRDAAAPTEAKPAQDAVDAVALSPEQEELVMDLAQKHNLGRRVGQIGTLQGVSPDVFYTDASYRTQELFDFAAELLASSELNADQRRALVGNWFAEDWAVHQALGLLDDYDTERAAISAKKVGEA